MRINKLMPNICDPEHSIGVPHLI